MATTFEPKPRVEPAVGVLLKSSWAPATARPMTADAMRAPPRMVGPDFDGEPTDDGDDEDGEAQSGSRYLRLYEVKTNSISLGTGKVEVVNLMPTHHYPPEGRQCYHWIVLPTLGLLIGLVCSGDWLSKLSNSSGEIRTSIQIRKNSSHPSTASHQARATDPALTPHSLALTPHSRLPISHSPALDCTHPPLFPLPCQAHATDEFAALNLHMSLEHSWMVHAPECSMPDECPGCAALPMAKRKKKPKRKRRTSEAEAEAEAEAEGMEEEEGAHQLSLHLPSCKSGKRRQLRKKQYALPSGDGPDAQQNLEAALRVVDARRLGRDGSYRLFQVIDLRGKAGGGDEDVVAWALGGGVSSGADADEGGDGGDDPASEFEDDDY